MKFRLNLIGTSRNLNQKRKGFYLFTSGGSFMMVLRSDMSRSWADDDPILYSNRGGGFLFWTKTDLAHYIIKPKREDADSGWLFSSFKWWGWVGGGWERKVSESENRLAETWQRRKESKPTVCVRISFATCKILFLLSWASCGLCSFVFCPPCFGFWWVMLPVLAVKEIFFLGCQNNLLYLGLNLLGWATS